MALRAANGDENISNNTGSLPSRDREGAVLFWRADVTFNGVRMGLRPTNGDENVQPWTFFPSRARQEASTIPLVSSDFQESGPCSGRVIGERYCLGPNLNFSRAVSQASF